MPWTFNANYPGVTSFYSLRYITSLGISPGAVQIMCHPGSNPAAGGTLIFGVTDGATTTTLTLPDCKLDNIAGSSSASGRELTLRILDRRWKWVDRYPVMGHFNQVDYHHKLIPWTVRSAFQMAVYLLGQMGEPTPVLGWESVLDLPAGLAVAADATKQIPAPASFDQIVDGAADFLKCGVNFTRSRTNPITVWTQTPAAVALAQLCEQFGRAVALNPLTNTVSIVKLGTGTALPAGRQLQFAPAVDLESVPCAVTAMGSPTRYQMRLRLRAVGQDWDGDWKPLERLSYAPPLPGAGQAMIATAEILGYDAALAYTLLVNGVTFTVAVGAHASVADVVTALVAAINASADVRISGKVTAASVTTVPFLARLKLTGAITPTVGYEFKLRPETPAYWQLRALQGPIPSPSVQPHRQTVAIDDPKFLFVSAAARITVVVNGTSFTNANVYTPQVPPSILSALDDLANQINLDPVVSLIVKASAQGRLLALDGIAAGSTVTVTASVSGSNGVAAVTTVQPATSAAYGFQLSGIDGSLLVKSTDRLNWEEARALARRSVNSCYQLVCEDPADGTVKAIPVPVPLASSKDWTITVTDLGFNFLALRGVLRVVIDGVIFDSTAGLALAAAVADLATTINGAGGASGYATANGYVLSLTAPLATSTVVASVTPVDAGTVFAAKALPASVAMRYLLTLLNTRVEQIMPRGGDTTVIDPRTTQPYALDTYNGYSSDRQPATFASINAGCWNGLWYKVTNGLGPHTQDNQQVFIPFQIADAERQVIRFERPLYRLFGQSGVAAGSMVTLPADPVIEIGCLVADPATLAPYRYSVTVTIPGATAPPVTRIFEDVQDEVLGIYDAQHRLVDVRRSDADAQQRALNYASETALKYQFPGSQTITYSSMVGIPIDGLVRQVEWSFSRSGFTTTASENSEFSRVIPPYGDRRRMENLTPDAQRAMENLQSHPFYRQLPKNLADAAKSLTRGLFGG